VKILLQPVPHEEAARFIAGKPAVGRGVFDGLLPELKARAFTIAGVESADTLQRARDLIAALPQGADWGAQKAQLLGEISPWLVDDNADPETREKQVEAAARRAETLMRLHGFQAYAAAGWQVMDRQRDAFPFWMYQTFGDGRVRPAHAALNGLVLPADHPFWKDHYAPWDWGCRCQVVPVTAGEATDAARANAGNGAGWAPGPEALKRMEQTGMLDLGDGKPVDIRSPRDKAAAAGEDPAAKFGWDPGDLRIPLEALKARYDAATWGAFETMARSTGLEAGGQQVSLWDWLGGNPIIVPAAPAPAAQTPLAFADILQRHGLNGKKAWTEDEARAVWRDLNKGRGAAGWSAIASVTGHGTGVFSEAAIRAGAADFIGALPDAVLKSLPKVSIRAVTSSIGALADYDPAGHVIRLCVPAIQSLLGSDKVAVVRERIFHEMGHWVHINGPPWYRKRINALWKQRTGGEAAVMSPAYGCLIKRDRWYDEYAGRIYDGYNYDGLEVVTRHIQLLANPRRMATEMLRDNGETIAENLSTVLSVFFEGGAKA